MRLQERLGIKGSARLWGAGQMRVRTTPWPQAMDSLPDHVEAEEPGATVEAATVKSPGSQSPASKTSKKREKKKKQQAAKAAAAAAAADPAAATEADATQPSAAEAPLAAAVDAEPETLVPMDAGASSEPTQQTVQPGGEEPAQEGLDAAGQADADPAAVDGLAAAEPAAEAPAAGDGSEQAAAEETAREAPAVPASKLEDGTEADATPEEGAEAEATPKPDSNEGSEVVAAPPASAAPAAKEAKLSTAAAALAALQAAQTAASASAKPGASAGPSVSVDCSFKCFFCQKGCMFVVSSNTLPLCFVQAFGEPVVALGCARAWHVPQAARGSPISMLIPVTRPSLPRHCRRPITWRIRPGPGQLLRLRRSRLPRPRPQSFRRTSCLSTTTSRVRGPGLGRLLCLSARLFWSSKGGPGQGRAGQGRPGVARIVGFLGSVPDDWRRRWRLQWWGSCPATSHPPHTCLSGLRAESGIDMTRKEDYLSAADFEKVWAGREDRSPSHSCSLLFPASGTNEPGRCSLHPGHSYSATTGLWQNEGGVCGASGLAAAGRQARRRSVLREGACRSMLAAPSLLIIRLQSRHALLGFSSMH